MTSPRLRAPARRRAETGPAVGEVARIAHRLAVLLEAGVAPAAAWRHVAGPGPPAWVARVAAAAEDPAAVAPALAGIAGGRGAGAGEPARGGRPRDARSRAPTVDGDALRSLAAMWAVATVSGAPLAGALRDAARAMREAAEARRAAEAALAGPRATTRLVVAMPAVAVVFGTLLGYDTIGVLLGTPIGWACAAAGLSLVLAARAWSRRLVARAAEADPAPGLGLELVAVAMAGGVPADRAESLASSALAECGLPSSTAAAAPVIAVARSAGAPVAELLRAEAEEGRRASATAAAARAAVLETSLMVPLGVCVLPAFILLGVVPLLVAVLTSTLAVL